MLFHDLSTIYRSSRWDTHLSAFLVDNSLVTVRLHERTHDLGITRSKHDLWAVLIGVGTAVNSRVLSSYE